MSKRTNLIPRKIWILWYQGVTKAPFIVRHCINSWIEENPTWDVVLLDRDNLGDYITMDLPDEKLLALPLVKQANLVRLQLLSEYGGVWTDATTFCMKPLDDWIDECTTSGFFAFHRPGRDRLMSSWFMACEAGSPIVLKLKYRYTTFFTENTFNSSSLLKRNIKRLLITFLNRSDKTTRYWLSPVVTRGLKVYPYHIFHYIFERLVSTDSECQTIWNNTPKVSADGPHRLKRVGLLSPADETVKNEIDTKMTPIYKLTWKYDHSKYSPLSVLYYLLQGRHQNK